MPKPAHTRATWSGTLGGGLEEWSFSLNLRGDAALLEAGNDILADALRTAWATHLRPLYGTDTVLTEARYAPITGEGKYVTLSNGAFVHGISSTSPISGSGSASTHILPLQTALVVSLMTARAGATGKGRIFLPWPQTLQLAADYRISTVAQTSVLNGVKAFINAVNSLSTNERVAVVSSKGYTTDVSAVRVGRVPDTMRSRRGDLVEAYAQVSLT